MDRVEKMEFDVSRTSPPIDDIADIVKDYFDDGNLKSIQDGSGTMSFTYDGVGRMKSKTNSAGSLAYEYDLAGNLTASRALPWAGQRLPPITATTKPTRWPNH